MDHGAPLLSVVMPVYNERDGIGPVLQAWTSEFDRLGVSYEFLVYDDGSRDGTDTVLRAITPGMPHVRVIHQANMGHGPTILRGYREARGTWIFQTDSDDEMDVGGFRDLWARREQYDFLLATRAGRVSSLSRRVVSLISRVLVRGLFGRGIDDVNVPYRLMRGSELRRLLDVLPDDLFAPNVILSGLAVRHRLRVFQAPVGHVNRRHGQSSLGSLSIFRPAMRAMRQTLAVAWRARGHFRA